MRSSLYAYVLPVRPVRALNTALLEDSLKMFLFIRRTHNEVCFFLSFEGKSCPIIEAPTHGSVVVPCIEKYGLTCLIRCSKGYYLDGIESTKCGMSGNQTAWNVNEIACKGNVLSIRKHSCINYL